MSSSLSSAPLVPLVADRLLTPGNQAGALKSSQLIPKAKEFESILLSQWLQGAETSFGSVPGGDEDQDAGDEQMRGFAVQQLAQAFSEAGGIGIAKMVTKALLNNSESSTGGTDRRGQ